MLQENDNSESIKRGGDRERERERDREKERQR